MGAAIEDVRYGLVIFDFDGTLADSFGVFLEAGRLAARRFGLKFPGEGEIDRFRGYGARRIVREMGIAWWRLPALAREMRRLVGERLERVRLFPGVEAMLHRLAAARIRIAIVTSNSKANVERILGEHARHVDHWGCSASAFGKGRRVRAVIQASGVDRRRVLCVGDEIRDAEVAARLGVDFAGVAWGYTHEKALAALPKVRICRSLDDLLDLVGVGCAQDAHPE